jgi:hypothetical protein
MRLAPLIWSWILAHPLQSIGLAVALVALAATLAALLVAVLPIQKVPLRYNLRNLQVRWRTTLVTGLAFTLVTTLMTVMLAFVTGMKALTEGTGHPGNVMVLSDGSIDEVMSNLPPIGVGELPADLQQLIERDGNEHLYSPEVYVIAVYDVPHPVPGGRKHRFVQMRGLVNMRIAAKVHEIDLATGNWPSAGGARSVRVEKDGTTIETSADEVVVGDGLATAIGADLGKARLAPGDVIEITPNHYWVVAGVMLPGTNTFGSEIWARHTVIQETFGRTNSFSSYVVRTANAQIAEAASVALRQLQSARTLQASPERAYYAKLSETNKQFSLAVGFIAAVMAAGGVLGITNTMFAAISQRTKDIGVLRLMGYRRWQVFMSFQFESALIAILGGGLGLLIGYLIADGRTATSIVSGGAGGGKSVVLRLTVDLDVLSKGLFVSVLMGAFGGILPSFKAMRLRPLESLK